MKKIAVSVGLDYGMSGVRVRDASGKVPRNKRCGGGWYAVAGVAGKSEAVTGAVIEACTGAADLAEEPEAHAGWPVKLAMPGIGKKMKLNPDQTDWRDARVLRDLGRIH